jgi:hypothetical protein
MAECYHTLSICMARVAKLASNGYFLTGSKNLYVTDSILTLTLQLQLKAGADFEQDNGCGNLCFAFKNPDQIKGLNLQASFCQEDPELTELLSGGTLIASGGNSIGWAAPYVGTVPNPDGVSLEVWTQNINGSDIDASYPYVRWVFGKTRWTPADKNFAAGPIVHPFTGVAYQNPHFEDGAAEDWPYVSDRLWQYAGDTDLPSSVCGGQQLTAS